MKRTIIDEKIEQFKLHLVNEEKSHATIEKYIRDINAFSAWINDKELNKNAVIAYKEYLISRFQPSSVNSMLSSVNGFFAYLEWHDLRVKTLKQQKQIFSREEKELTKQEYERLLNAAKEKQNNRLHLIMQTICSSGIRISELQFVTVEAVRLQRAEVKCKGKIRTVILPKSLCKLLKRYIAENKIKSGSVFVTKGGKPLNRSNIWKDMKKLCKTANVLHSKVFPHNLRHLFARTFYKIEKDIVRLADLLGHSNVNTTRIYTIESGNVHRQKIQNLGLVCLRM